MQPIADYNVFFDNAKKALEESASIRTELKEARSAKTELERQLQDAKQKLDKAVKTELSEQRSRISRTYDTELDGAKQKLDEANRQRHKAKSKGVKERITQETSQLHAENRSIQGKITENIRDRNLPDYCEGWLFNLLYFPQGMTDHILLLLLQLLCYVAVPTLIALVTGTTNLWLVVGLFALDILICNTIYFSVLRGIVYKNYDVLSEAVESRAHIRDNEARIDEITDEIRNDPDETMYDLGSYDEEIGRTKQDMDRIERERAQALDAFDNETSAAVTKELTDKEQPHIDELSAGIERAARDVAELESQSRLKDQELSRDYEPYLGKQFMTPEKIDALRDIIDHGTATNITQAREEYEHRMED